MKRQEGLTYELYERRNEELTVRKFSSGVYEAVLTELEAAYRSRRRYKSSWDAVFSDEITEPMDELKNLLNREQNKTGQICFRLMEESIFQIDADLWLNTLALLLYTK